jgi:hypothetical protein
MQAQSKENKQRESDRQAGQAQPELADRQPNQFEAPVHDAVGMSTIARVVAVGEDGCTLLPKAVVTNPVWKHSDDAVAEMMVRGSGEAYFKGLRNGHTTITVSGTVTTEDGKKKDYTRSTVLTIGRLTPLPDAAKNELQADHKTGLQILFTTPAA